ncbi:hypothetical protein KIN20_017325 [Parelaphostrongylus tenuis]|uniref:Uncharacterized protein n=1 Tax=Parelaphostrongylus tenuis TaxID=148309 RepID=A0AAD5MN27_PARTN|nr:hypothetical protein KIN20_017325 [Parelaphostrongylus tenuis]
MLYYLFADGAIFGGGRLRRLTKKPPICSPRECESRVRDDHCCLIVVTSDVLPTIRSDFGEVHKYIGKKKKLYKFMFSLLTECVPTT